MSFEVTRMDIVSKKRYPSKDLFRLVVINNSLQLSFKRNDGRGIYILKDKATIDTLRHKNLLRKYTKDTSSIEDVLNSLEKLV